MVRCLLLCLNMQDFPQKCGRWYSVVGSVVTTVVRNQSIGMWQNLCFTF